jgi:hypothetical protein
MIIHKSHSKTDLTELINNLNLKIVFSHQDNKKNIQDKLNQFLKNKKIKLDEENFYKIKTRDDLIFYLKNKNPKKTLSIKEKEDVMKICKSIIQYCKNNYDIDCCDYSSLKEIEDDMDFIKQFGDIPSVRRCCKLLKDDVKFAGRGFTPLISPQIQKDLEEKNKIKKIYPAKLVVRHSTPENPIILVFD